MSKSDLLQGTLTKCQTLQEHIDVIAFVTFIQQFNVFVHTPPNDKF